MAQFETTEFQLKEENEKLKSIIKQMRQDMENLAADPDFIPTKQSRLELAQTDTVSDNQEKTAKSQSAQSTEKAPSFYFPEILGWLN